MTIALQPSRLIRHVLTAVLILLVVAWFHVAHAATTAPAPTQADIIEKVQEQVRTLDKENAVLIAKIEAQNNRIADLSLAATQQGNHIAAVSNQTTTLGNYISIGGVFITVLLIFTGFFTYRNGKSEAKETAQQEARTWIDQHAAKLAQQVADLEAKVQKATQDIDGHIEAVAMSADDAQTRIKTNTAAMAKAAELLLRPEKASSGDTADQEASRQITRISEELKTKPESEFTSADHFARGLAIFNAGNYEGALSSFEAAYSEPTLSAPDAARYLFAQGVALSRLDRKSQAITVYDELVQRFGADSSPGVRKQVASAMFNRGFQIGELLGPEKAITAYDEMVQRFGADSSPGVREPVAKAMVNRGIEISKLHGPEKAIATYDELVQRFGDDSSPGVREQVADAKNGAAFSAMLLAKGNWNQVPLRAQHLQRALALLESLVEQAINNPMYSGNLGYCHFLLDNTAAARKWTQACLETGGEAQLEAQRGDAKLHRVEPQDTAYEALLDELWQQIRQ